MSQIDNPFDAPEPPSDAEMPSQDDRNLAVVAHLTGALFNFLGPLLVYLLKKDSSRYVEDQAREALNFQVTLLLMYFVCGVIGAITCVLAFLPLLPWVVQIVFGIMGTLAAREGRYYRYPFNVRLIG